LATSRGDGHEEEDTQQLIVSRIPHTLIEELFSSSSVRCVIYALLVSSEDEVSLHCNCTYDIYTLLGLLFN